MSTEQNDLEDVLNDLTTSDEALQELAVQFIEGLRDGADAADQVVRDVGPGVQNALTSLANEQGLEGVPEAIERVLTSAPDEIANNLTDALAGRAATELDFNDKQRAALKAAARNTKPMLQDMKEIWKKHVGYVLREYRRERRQGKARKLGAILSFTGKAWDAVSEFWDEYHSKHPVLKPLDKLVIKPVAISLYVANLPVIGAIKAAEFLGRTLTEYGKRKGRKEDSLVLPSIIKAAKQTGASILKHFLRVSVGQEANPAIKAFYDKLGISDEFAKVVLDAVTAPDLMQFVEQLSPEQAGIAAEVCGNLLDGLGHKEAALAAKLIIPAVLHQMQEEEMKSAVDALTKGELKEAWDKAPESFQNAALAKIAEVASEQTDLDIAGLIRTTQGVLQEREISLDLEGFKAYVKEKNPELDTTLQTAYKAFEAKDNVSLTQFEEMLSQEKGLKKLKKSVKKELREFATEYAIQQTLGEVEGLRAVFGAPAAERGRQEVGEALGRRDNSADRRLDRGEEKRGREGRSSFASKFARPRSKSLSHLDALTQRRRSKPKAQSQEI